MGLNWTWDGLLRVAIPVIIIACVYGNILWLLMYKHKARRWSNEQIRDWRIASNTPASDNSDLNAALDKAKAAASESPGYQQALLQGFVGTPEEWVMSIIDVSYEEEPVVYVDRGRRVMNWTVCEILLMGVKEQTDEVPD